MDHQHSTISPLHLLINIPASLYVIKQRYPTSVNTHISTPIYLHTYLHILYVLYRVFKRVTLNDFRLALSHLGAQTIVLSTSQLQKLRCQHKSNEENELPSIYMPTRCYGGNREQTNWIGLSFTRLANLAASLTSPEGRRCYEHSYLNKSDNPFKVKIPEKTNNSPFIYKLTGNQFETHPIISHAWARRHLVNTWVHWASAIVIAAQIIHKHDVKYQKHFTAWKTEGTF